MLDLVPLARAWREVANVDVESGRVSEALQLDAPQARARSVASSAVGSDEELGRVRVPLRPISRHQRSSVATANSAVS